MNCQSDGSLFASPCLPPRARSPSPMCQRHALCAPLSVRPRLDPTINRGSAESPLPANFESRDVVSLREGVRCLFGHLEKSRDLRKSEYFVGFHHWPVYNVRQPLPVFGKFRQTLSDITRTRRHFNISPEAVWNLSGAATGHEVVSQFEGAPRYDTPRS
jgi:hypothetical protein